MPSAVAGTRPRVPRPASTLPTSCRRAAARTGDRKSTRLNSSHGYISYAVFCLQNKIRREGAPDPSLHGFGDVTVDFARHQVRRAGRTAELRPKEYALLVALLKRGVLVASRL